MLLHYLDSAVSSHCDGAELAAALMSEVEAFLLLHCCHVGSALWGFTAMITVARTLTQ